MRILVTGGAGFIGSAVCRYLVSDADNVVVNLDKLTYAGNLQSLRFIENRKNYTHVYADICDEERLKQILHAYRIEAIMHLAAESHVDRSVDGPADFVQTNIVGTYHLLNAALSHWSAMAPDAKARFRLHHVSTDEVYGDLPMDSGMFREETPYAPSSPYSASKAASDHLVRAWGTTYGLPIVLSNCSNNYGPYHFPEKLIPLMILNALEEKPLPVYGTGENVRDWLHVADHARALERVLKHGRTGESYNIGANEERTNLQVVETICDILDQRKPRSNGKSYRNLIEFVADRPGHDRRYAIDSTKIRSELDWQPLETFEGGLLRTVDWYLNNEWWWRPIRERTYGGDRLGDYNINVA